MSSGEATVDITLGGVHDAFMFAGELDGYGTQNGLPDNSYSRRLGVGTATAIGVGNEINVDILASVDNLIRSKVKHDVTS